MAEKALDTKSVPQNMVMSRQETPEHTEEFVLNIREAQHLKLYDETGSEVRFGDIYKSQRTIVLFVRKSETRILNSEIGSLITYLTIQNHFISHFLCFMCKEYVDDLAIIPEEYLKAANVKIVVIGCAPAKFIKPFRYDTQYGYEIYTDPDRVLFKKMGLLEKANPMSSLEESRHVKSNALLGVLKSTWRGMEYREMQGDMHQQGGAFILGPGTEVLYQHRDQTPTDHAPINSLLAAAGVEQVSFAKDPRIITV